MNGDSREAFDPDRQYHLNPNVSLRPESFGALAYHFGTRRLSFLKTPLLVTIVRSLGDYDSARESLSANGVGHDAQDGYLRALAALATTDMIVPA